MGFKWIFWGLILLLFGEIRFHGFDLLPDLIPCLLIYMGLGKLIARNDYFERARTVTTILMGLSLLTLYRFADIHVSRITSVGLLQWGIIQINLAGLGTLVYYLCRGVHQVATTEGNHYLQNETARTWKAFWGAVVLASIQQLPNRDSIGHFIENYIQALSSSTAGMVVLILVSVLVVFPLVAYVFVSIYWVLNLMWRAGTAFEPAPEL